MTSLRLILALATIYDYYIHQMDVITAFLHGVLREEIYFHNLKVMLSLAMNINFAGC